MLGWLGIKSKRILLQYLFSLEPYFVIYYNGNSCSFKMRPFNPVDMYRVDNTEMHKYLHYRFVHICRKYKIPYTSTDLKDFICLFRQYPTKHRQLLISFLKSVRKVKSVQPALIHSMVLRTA